MAHCFLDIPRRVRMLKGSIPVLSYRGNLRHPPDRVRKAALSLICCVFFTPIGPAGPGLSV
jgi:hypothetical protein